MQVKDLLEQLHKFDPNYEVQIQMGDQEDSEGNYEEPWMRSLFQVEEDPRFHTVVLK